MNTVTLEELDKYEEGHCDRKDRWEGNDDLIIKKYLLQDTYTSYIPYYTSNSMEELNELIDERFVFNDVEISDDDLSNLLIEVENINDGEQITYFEILTAAYFYYASKFKDLLA